MYNKIKATADYISKEINNKPIIGIVCGSGLANIVNIIQKEKVLDYSDIPNFPISTVEGHKSKLIFGTLGNKQVIAMQGRFHFYEGYTMEEVTFAIRVMKELGVEKLILTNAAGGVNINFNVGDIMIIEDHINLLPNPLIGKNDQRLGIRFPAMNKAYSPSLIAKAELIAKENNIKLQKGVYLGNTGPTFETPSEYKFYHSIGADAVGMSTTPEVIVGVHSSMEVFAMSLISNVFRDDLRQEATMKEVLEAGLETEGKMMLIVEKLIERI
ncbi:MAG: purine-nucleoside phosphorylase [Bacteroidales bacterium]|nr:purine-nucleoside phosphorylase [Bacteroidales bacterium]